MQRVAISMFVLAVGTGCTAPKPEPEIRRDFSGHYPKGAPPTDEIFDEALDPHGISCPSFEGSDRIEGSSWRTSCFGTHREWVEAEATLARLSDEGVAREREVVPKQ